MRKEYELPRMCPFTLQLTPLSSYSLEQDTQREHFELCKLSSSSSSSSSSKASANTPSNNNNNNNNNAKKRENTSQDLRSQEWKRRRDSKVRGSLVARFLAANAIASASARCLSTRNNSAVTTAAILTHYPNLLFLHRISSLIAEGCWWFILNPTLVITPLERRTIGDGTKGENGG